MMEMEKAKRRNEKVWTSLLFHFSLFLFTFTLSAGHPSLESEKACVDDFFTIPSKFVDDLAVIPGDADFYQVLGIEDGATWNVYTNGLLALASESIYVIPERQQWLNKSYDSLDRIYDRYHVSLFLYNTLYRLNLEDYIWQADGSAYPWFPNIIDISYETKRDRTLIRFVCGGGGTSKSIGQVTGLGDLYHPRSFRLDNHTYMALLTSYAAYFERLYYASEGQTNAWDDAGRWGDYGPSDKFVFSLTNSEYSARNCYFDWIGTNVQRSVEDCRKLKEWARNRDLRAEIRDDMFRREVISEYDDKPVNPDFIYRPGWLLDRDESPYSYDQNPSRGGPWWTSQADPPAWDDGPSQQATTSGFHFFPEFGWTNSPVSVNGSPNLDWSDYCVTFNMARAQDRDADPTHPLAELFRRVGYSSGPDGWHVDAIIRPYRFMSATGRGFGLYEWMTNAYPRCVSQYYDKTLAFEGYRDQCWGIYGEDPSRRLLPNDYVGINQVLGAMDRTLHIPDLAVTSTNRVTSVSRRGEYLGDECQLTLTWRYGAIPTVDATPILGVTLKLDSSTNRISSTVASTGVDGLYVAADSPSTDLAEYSVYIPMTNDIAIQDHDFNSAFGYDDSGTIEIVSLTPSLWSGRECLDVGFVETNDTTRATNYFYGVTSIFGYRPFETNVTFRPAARAVRSYSYEQPEVILPRLGPTQPGKSAGDRCASSQYGMLSSMSVFHYNLTNCSWETIGLYRAYPPAEYKGRGVLESSIRRRFDTQAGEMFALIPKYQQDDPKGPRPDNPEGYAPLPNSIWPVDIFPSIASLRDFGAEATLNLDETKVTTNLNWTYWFESESNVTYSVFNVFEASGTELYNNIEYYVTNYLESGLLVTNRWGFLPETSETEWLAETNQVDEYTQKYPFVFKAGPFPAPVDMVEVTNYWEFAEIYNIDGRALTNNWQRDIVHVNYMSGTGPDDPGWDAGYDVITNTTYLYQDGGDTDRRDRTSQVYLSYPERPASEAIHVEVTNVVYHSSGVYIDYTIDNGRVDARPFRLWVNLMTGEVVREELPFPLVVGRLWSGIDVRCHYDFGEVYFGGPEHEIEMRGDGKIITQTDWQWKNLKRTDQ